MRLFLSLSALLLAAFCAEGQDQASHTAVPEAAGQPLNVLIDRLGVARDVDYGFVEWFQTRRTKHPKWSIIVPDVGMVFFGDVERYREVFAGVGFEVHPTDALAIAHVAYYDQATGLDGHGKFWYQPWTKVNYDFPRHIGFETVLIPYIPLNGGTAQLVVERVKLEYRGFERFNFGGGYGAYQEFGITNWENEPFVSVTLKTARLGNFEVWRQQLGNGFRLQYRHSISWHGR